MSEPNAHKEMGVISIRRQPHTRHAVKSYHFIFHMTRHIGTIVSNRIILGHVQTCLQNYIISGVLGILGALSEFLETFVHFKVLRALEEVEKF